jgi:hypothetical protein
LLRIPLIRRASAGAVGLNFRVDSMIRALCWSKNPSMKEKEEADENTIRTTHEN